MRKVVVHARSVAKHEFPGTGVRFIMFIPGFGFLLYQSPSIVHPPCGIGAGGRPFLVLISLPKTESRVPRPRDFCEGGNDTANATGSEERFVVHAFPFPPFASQRTGHPEFYFEKRHQNRLEGSATRPQGRPLYGHRRNRWTYWSFSL